MKHTVFLVAAVALVGACADDPVAIRLDVQDVTVSTPEDTALVVQLQVDSNRPVQATITGQPAHGVIADLGSSTYSYTPAKDYTGPDTVAVTFNNGTETVVGTAHITVTPVDDVPVAGPDSFAAGFSATVTTATSTLLANDTDPENDPLTVTEVSAATHGTVTLSGGNAVFVPEPNYNGLAGYAYRVSDGMMSSLGNVTITVGANNIPNAINDTVAGSEDANVVVQAPALLSNDTDGDNQTLAITAVGGATHGTVSKTGNAITFVPDANYNGVATFTYSVTDGAGVDDGTVTINLAAVNDAPLVIGDTGFQATEDSQFTFTKAQLLGNDTDIDGDLLRITAVGGAVNCTVSLPASAVGDTVLLVPNANFNGSASFTYTVSDGTTSATGTVTLTVGAVNDVPVATDDVATGAEDTVISISGAALLGNDADADADSLSLTAVSNPTNGTVALSAGQITFTPAANFNGAARFDYTLSDGTTSDTGSVTVNVSPVNDAPVALDDSATTAEDVSVGIAVLLNDTDVDTEALMIMSTTQPAHGTVTVAGTIATYTPAANYKGPDSFTYVARDAGGLTSTANVTIAVTNVNDVPVGIADLVTTNEDTVALIDAAANDMDADGDPLTVTTASQPAHGLTAVVNGKIEYTPALNYFGMDAFTYSATDGNGGTATAMVTITVGAVNDAPVGEDDLYVVNDMAAIIAPGVLINDRDVDSTALTAMLVTPPVGGTLVLNPDGSFTYTPALCSQLETFTYVVSDGAATSAPVTVTLKVNHTPVANYDLYSTQMDTTLDVPGTPQGQFFGVLNNDDDPDPEPITAQIVQFPANGQLTLRPDGSFVYIPAPGFTGDDSFQYTAADATTVSNVATVYITVYCPNFVANPTNEIGAANATTGVIAHGGSGSGGCFQPLAIDPEAKKLRETFLTASRPFCCGPVVTVSDNQVFGCNFLSINAQNAGGQVQKTEAAQQQ